jgi:uncharacterized membrane protein YdfJ with MMPL/SSD domain
MIHNCNWLAILIPIVGAVIGFFIATSGKSGQGPTDYDEK